MGNSLGFKLKKWHLNSMRANYVRMQTVRLPDGKSQEVMVFSGEKCVFLAQYTPLRTIAIHERVFEDNRLLEYVIAHEIAHKKQWWSFFRLPIAALAVFYAPELFNTGLDSMYDCILNQNWSGLACSPVWMIAAVLTIALTVAFSWLTEIDADFRAIKVVGIDTFLDLHRSSCTSHKLGFNKVIILLTHPPVRLTLGLWRKLHKIENFRSSEATIVSQTVR